MYGYGVKYYERQNDDFCNDARDCPACVCGCVCGEKYSASQILLGVLPVLLQ